MRDANRIRVLREAKDLKPYELATKVGVNPSTIIRWEKGYTIPAQILPKLAHELGASIDHVMCWDEKKAA